MGKATSDTLIASCWKLRVVKLQRMQDVAITTFTPLAFAQQFADVGLAALIYTDIDRDEDHPESSMAHVTDLAAKIRPPVIASGVVKTLDDISTLSYLPNIAGVITSRALFGGAFSFPEAKAIATAQHAPAAPFV